MPESFMPATNAGQSAISAMGAAVEAIGAGAGAAPELGAGFARAPAGGDSDFDPDEARDSARAVADSEGAAFCLTALTGAPVPGPAAPLASSDVTGSNARSRNSVIAKPVGSSGASAR